MKAIRCWLGWHDWHCWQVRPTGFVEPSHAADTWCRLCGVSGETTYFGAAEVRR